MSPVIHVLFFLEVYTKTIVLTILASVQTLRKYSPLFNSLKYLTWHVVTSVQEIWLKAFSVT